MTQEEINQNMNTMFRQAEQQLNKQIFDIQYQQKLIKQEMKKYGNQPDILKIYGKSLVTSQKQITRIYQQISSLKSLQSQMKNQMAQQKVNNIVGQIGTFMQNTIQASTPEEKSAIRMFALQNEKMTQQLGMIDDIMDDAFADDEISEAADKEVNKVIEETVGQQLSKVQIEKIQQQSQENKAMEELNQKMAKLQQ